MADNRTATSAVAPTGRGDPLRDAHQKIEQAETLRLQHQYDRARVICEGLLRQYPDYFAACFTLGLICIDARKYSDALAAMARAVMLDPLNWQALNALGALYLKVGAHEMAARVLEQAAAIRPDEPTVQVALGEVYRDDHEFERAREAFRRAYALDRTIPVAGAGYGHCCAELGDHVEAARVFEELLVSGRGDAAVLAQLLELPVRWTTINAAAALGHVASIAQPDKESQDTYDSIVAFARAALHHRAGHHREAWETLVAVNRKQYGARRKRAAALAAEEKESLAQLRQRALTPAINQPGDGELPVSLFILGASRSGKTTLESLAAHLPGIKIGYENPILSNVTRRAFQRAGFPAERRLNRLPARFDQLYRSLYREELLHRAGAAQVFTITHPNYIHDAARVASVIPNVRFVLVKRDLNDTMFRIFARGYSTGNDYAYDLATIRDHVAWYDAMIDALAKKLPAVTRVIRYEDMIANPREALADVACLCGLSMPDGALPDPDDDRGCAQAYCEAMAAAIA